MANKTDEKNVAAGGKQHHHHHKKRKRSVRYRIAQTFRYTLSVIIIGFALFMVFFGICTGQTNFSVTFSFLPPWTGIFVLLAALYSLGMLEGLQIAIVELKQWDIHAFKKSHPRAYTLQTLLSDHCMVERFLIGRQVFVVLLVFFAALLTSFPSKPGESPFWPDGTLIPTWFTSIFLTTGLLGALVVVAFAQLLPQLVASRSPIYFLNVPGGFFFVIACTAFEWSGIIHSSWLLTYTYEFLVHHPREERKLVEEAAIFDLTSPLSAREEIIPEAHTSPFSQLLRTLPASELQTLEKKIELTYSQEDGGVKVTDSERMHLAPQDYFPPIHVKSKELKGRLWASPAMIGKYFEQAELQFPDFLRPPEDERHVPPHIVATYLLFEYARLDRHLHSILAHKQVQLSEESEADSSGSDDAGEMV